MRFAVAVAPFAGLAAGFAIVDPQVFESIPVTPAKHHHDCHESSWWESHIRSAKFEAIAAAVASEPDSGDGQALKSIGHTLDELLLSKEEGDVVTVSSDGPRHDDGSSSSTIYEIISKSNYTTRFAELVYDFPELVQLLNSTEANYTVFVPTNSAFEHIPDDGKKPSKEFVENVLKYHIGVGLYPAKRFIFTHTIPSVLEESLLGGNPQRLRTSFSLLRGARVNLFTKVVYADVVCRYPPARSHLSFHH